MTTAMTQTDDLSMNETPFPPLPAIQGIVEQAAATLNRYPDHTSAALLTGLAGTLGVPRAEIVVGPGSAGLCQHLLQALGAGGGTEIVLPGLSFEAYPLLAVNAGARPVFVPPVDGGRHDLTAMLAAVGPQTRAVLLCVPNNPTGAVLNRAEISAFLDQVPPTVPVVIDEAYREFNTDPDAPDGVALHRTYPNVCALRTFSKAYGLAALRIGYAVAAPAVVAATRMVGQVFFPGAASQAAALATLAEPVQRELRDRCATLTEQRAALAAALAGVGLPVAPSQANFLWSPLGAGAAPLAEKLRTAGILVRAYPGQGVRITVGTPAANQRLVDAIAACGF